MNPQLAVHIDLSLVSFPLLGFPKIDGVRTWNPEGTMIGRSMEPLANKELTEFYSHPLCLGFDAEICNGDQRADNACRKTTSLVNTIDGGLDESRLYVFDYITRSTFFLPLEERLRKLKIHLEDNVSMLAPELNRRISIMEHGVICSMEELEQCDQYYTGQGYEGTVFRNPRGTFRSGRQSPKSCNYLRLKHFEDREGIILDVLEGFINNNPQTYGADGYAKRSTHVQNMLPSGSVGSLVVRDIISKKIVTVSKGKLSKAECDMYFKAPELAKGRLCTYRIFPKGSLNLPRHPTFQNFRSPQDFDRSGA